jgi:hypothetical protein
VEIGVEDHADDAQEDAPEERDRDLVGTSLDQAIPLQVLEPRRLIREIALEVDSASFYEPNNSLSINFIDWRVRSSRDVIKPVWWVYHQRLEAAV